MPKTASSQNRVMLLLPPELLHFVDLLREDLAAPGIKPTRQDAIRLTLSQLAAQRSVRSDAAGKPARSPRRNR